MLANGGRGGMQAQVLSVAGELAQRGHRVTIAVGGGALMAPDGVDVVALPVFSPRNLIAFVVALRRVARQRSVDVLHGHGLRLAPVLRTVPSHRRFVTCHGVDPLNAARSARSAKFSGVAVISCGRGPQELLRRYGVDSDVIDNAFIASPTSRTRAELCREFDVTSDVAIIVYPARYSRQKAHDRFIEALVLVREQMGDNSPEVLCFGDGPLFDELRDRANWDSSRPLARILPYRSDASSWLAASDFFVLPSRWEGQPLVVLEALSHSLSVVTLTESVEDLVVEGRNGRMVHSIGQLASVIEQWSVNSASRPRDDDLNARLLQEHSLATVVDRYEELYRVGSLRS